MNTNPQEESSTAASVGLHHSDSGFGIAETSIASARNHERAWNAASESSRSDKVAVNSQTLESRLAEILVSEEWDQLIKWDAARSRLLSQTRLQIQSSLGALAYINDIEATGNSIQSPSREQLTLQRNHDARVPTDASINEDISSPRVYRDSEAGKGWKLQVKRWKRVDGRTGSTDFYDESEKIEDIRRREREIHGGGYVLNVYDVYDADGKDCQCQLEISSAPLLVSSVRHLFPFACMPTSRTCSLWSNPGRHYSRKAKLIVRYASGSIEGCHSILPWRRIQHPERPGHIEFLDALC